MFHYLKELALNRIKHMLLKVIFFMPTWSLGEFFFVEINISKTFFEIWDGHLKAATLIKFF